RTATAGSKRSRLDSHREEQINKRQKSLHAYSRSPPNLMQQDTNPDQFEAMDVDTDEECEDQYSEQGYEPIAPYIPVQSPPDVANKPFASPEISHTLTPRSFNHPSVSLSFLPASMVCGPPIQLSPRNDQGEPNATTFTLRANLYDYQNPWSAIGVILGLEEERPTAPAPQEPPGHLPAEIFDHPDDAASFHSQLFSDTSSTFSRGSKSAHHDGSNLFTDDGSHSPVPLTPARPASRTHSDDTHNEPTEEFPIAGPQDPQRCTTPELNDTEPLADSIYASSPTTPLSLDKTNPSCSLDDFHDERGTPAAHIRTPSPVDLHLMERPVPSLLFGDVPRVPKFDKFPLAVDVKRDATHISAFKPIHTPRAFKFPPPRPSPSLKSSTSRSPPSRLEAERHEAVSPAEVHDQRGPDDLCTERPVEDADVCVEPEVDLPHVLCAAQALEEEVCIEQAAEDAEADVPVPSTCQPEKFFGDLCLFSDDMADPDSDD
ncbi:hypothetical protein DFH09DRAFT_1465265, partial [Mycena vulgaris]